MPYIDPHTRAQVMQRMGEGLGPSNVGELNYVLSTTIDCYLNERASSYQVLNDVIGALECAKQELYRRLVAPYEDRKRDENGEVYTTARYFSS